MLFLGKGHSKHPCNNICIGGLWCFILKGKEENHSLRTYCIFFWQNKTFRTHTCSIWKGPSGMCGPFVWFCFRFGSCIPLASETMLNFVFQFYCLELCNLSWGKNKQTNTHIPKYLYQKQIFRTGSSAMGTFKCPAVIASFHVTVNSSERPDHVLGWSPVSLRPSACLFHLCL